KLRRGLRRRSITTTEIDIWSDSKAAERVRAVTGGDETVPTVFVGTQALVNPSVRAVVAAIEGELGDRAHEILGGGESVRRPRWSPLFKGARPG
ncbi:MAG: NrdH-redoxin, partial [Actinomycetia bacterium]|nr:NrdH-redoxin [Actinomycetes bacterium]